MINQLKQNVQQGLPGAEKELYSYLYFRGDHKCSKSAPNKSNSIPQQGKEDGPDVEYCSDCGHAHGSNSVEVAMNSLGIYDDLIIEYLGNTEETIDYEFLALQKIVAERKIGRQCLKGYQDDYHNGLIERATAEKTCSQLSKVTSALLLTCCPSFYARSGGPCPPLKETATGDAIENDWRVAGVGGFRTMHAIEGMTYCVHGSEDKDHSHSLSMRVSKKRNGSTQERDVYEMNAKSLLVRIEVVFRDLENLIVRCGRFILRTEYVSSRVERRQDGTFHLKIDAAGKHPTRGEGRYVQLFCVDVSRNNPDHQPYSSTHALFEQYNDLRSPRHVQSGLRAWFKKVSKERSSSSSSSSSDSS
jgi:hypothetical protein